LTYKPIGPLGLRIDVRYVGSRNDIFYDSKLGPYGALNTASVADYILADFSQRFSINDHLVILGRIENIFDTKYYEINGFTTRGRGVYISMRYSGQPF
jgi:vitamin B12 transporter